MKSKLIERTWISPFVTLTFCVIGVTGLLLFFHVKNGSIVMLHEWLGWGFVIAGVLHLLVNWRQLVSYLPRRSAMVALAVCAILVAALIVAGGLRSGGGPPASVMTLLDVDHNGVIDGAEITNASAALLKLDRNRDNQLSVDELRLQQTDARNSGETR